MSNNSIYFRPEKLLQRFCARLLRLLATIATVFSAISPSYSQCTNCPPAKTYSGTVYASSINLSGYHACLAINGIYIVDQNVSITSSFIYLGPGAEIRIQSSFILDLNDCEISGCNEMWSKILVNAGGELVADNVKFEDGIHAIDARGNTVLTVKNCTFTNNYIGVQLLNKMVPSQAPSITFKEPFSNNIFQTDGGLLPPYNNQMSFAGMKTYFVAPATIGEVGYPQNQFLDVKHGIISDFSLITVNNALFQLSSLLTTMTAILSSQSTITVKGSTFNSCTKGISSSASNLVVSQNYFSAVFIGCEIINSMNKSVSITDNSLTNMRFFGIYAGNNGKFSSFKVNDNEIEMDYPISSPAACLRLESSTVVNQQDVHINNNDIDLYGSPEGVQAILNRNINIEDNDIDIFHATGLSPAMEHGIRLSSCDNSKILGNVVIASGSLGAQEIHAIELNNSANCRVCSNITDGSRVGFKFNDQNPATYFADNTIYDHHIGLFVGSDFGSNTSAYMGIQGPNNNARDNTWDGSYLDWGARNTSDQFWVGQSFFHVRNSSQPQMPPSIDATVQWFDDDGGGLSLSCPVDGEPNPHTEFEKSIAAGTISFSEYADAQLWRAQSTLYRQLKDNPELLEQDEDIDEFYDDAENGEIGAFYDIAEGISGLGIPDAQMEEDYEELYDSINIKMEELAYIDEQLLTASGSAYTDLVEDRLKRSSEVDSLYTELAVLDTILLEIRITSTEELITLNAAITPSALPQQYQQAVNEIYLNTIGKSIMELNSTQEEILEPIANTCIHEGGDAVLGARILLAMSGGEKEYDEEELCSDEEEAMVKPGQPNRFASLQQGQLALYPNPAKEELNIAFAPVKGTGHLEVFDQKGALKYTSVLEEGQTMQALPLKGFVAGLYIVSSTTTDYVSTHKLIVLE